MKYAPSAFANPTKECDVIMKGGITSGVVYPLAVTELAQAYRLKNIGGTSAGAIAAALAAAAELGRGNPQGGFHKLAELPGFLAGHLTSLFQPSAKTRPAFSVLLTWISPGKQAKNGKEPAKKPGKLAKLLAVVKKLAITVLKLIGFHPIAFLLGAFLGAALFWLVADYPSQGQLLVRRAMTLRVIFALFWGLLVALIVFAWRAVKSIQGNAFGMCTGMHAQEPPRRNSPEALTPWLAGLIDETAGKTGEPLTFGDLWGPGNRKEQEKDARLRTVNLEVMTTNVTHGRPMRLPFSTRELFFDPEELRLFFPKEIVKWMLDHPVVLDKKEDAEIVQRIVRDTPYRPLPGAADLPVIVAARMSLSFPVLISAVPLYAVDWSLTTNQDLKKAGKAPELDRCWFSDGGIGSNFPVHFFDGLLPSRPTFGINLRPFHPDHPKDPVDESKNVRFPTRAGQEIRPTWTKIDSLVSFVSAILNTMQNWVDNSQMRLPGYRDRVAHVHLTEDEGGMNLEMPVERVEALTKRGLAAGQMLQTLNWDGHRWIRYLTAMSQLEGKLGRMREVYLKGFGKFLAGYDSKQSPYEHSDVWKEFAMGATDGLMKTVEEWGSKERRLHDEPMPHPDPDLRILPRQ